MAVKPKYVLKGLFESGDKISSQSMIDLIDSTYTPIFIQGANINLTSIDTPSGEQITISVKEVKAFIRAFKKELKV